LSVAAAAPLLALLCRARSRLCALPLEHLVESMRPLPVVPLAGVPPFVSGVSIIRGAPVPVMDLGSFLGVAEPPQPTRFVTLRAGHRQVALAVEEILGLRGLLPASLDEMPPLLGHASEQAVRAVGTLDAELLLALRTARLVPESVWRALEAEGRE